VGCGIVRSEVSLNLHDAAGEVQLSGISHQHLAKKFASHAPRIARKERSIQRLKFRSSFTGTRAHASEILK
jgi:hypothetical protein